jgi:hypothetical protein
METEIRHLLLGRVLEEKLRREKRTRNLREVLVAAYETTPGPQFCVRRLEVVQHAAQALGIRVVNNTVFHEVENAACALGWEPIRNGGRSLFRCVKLRGQDDASALAASQMLRCDPRNRAHAVSYGMEKPGCANSNPG